MCFSVSSSVGLSPLSPTTVELAAAVVDDAGSSARFSFSNGWNAPPAFLAFSATGLHGDDGCWGSSWLQSCTDWSQSGVTFLASGGGGGGDECLSDVSASSFLPDLAASAWVLSSSEEDSERLGLSGMNSSSTGGGPWSLTVSSLPAASIWLLIPSIAAPQSQLALTRTNAQRSSEECVASEARAYSG
ncbi:Os02g0325800 [Oryza sativa Japonica Group]|uniref:Os02g0325800 protein n=1 Tax=Oryza sativa subsp. japonica TaxID=39947 RepID=A0A0P0VIC4_ORYSJ|nr:hypothetical protein EE612_010869 [Oryza sativa]BAS78408.1 Os02g0325800 [Oryza sativa Japonica Group]